MTDVLDVLGQLTDNLPWTVFLASAAVHAVLLITSPMQAVHKWYSRQSSDSDTPIPYFFACVGSSLWLRYALYINDIKLMLLQCYAVTLQIFFLIALIRYRTKKRKLIRIFLSAVLAMGLLFFYMSRLSFEDGKRFSGRCASGAQIAGSFVCPYLIYKAITTRVIDFIPIAPVAFTWVMEMHAIVYSIGIDDFYMLLANTIFFCMDGMLLAMFFIFPSEQPSQKVSVM
uniref:Sugar transporter SWEET n=1 Tax=Steinernema glaseri TaxID=37863 RepID=A0A1I8AAE8_9BILA